jgi:hypothetical protein
MPIPKGYTKAQWATEKAKKNSPPATPPEGGTNGGGTPVRPQVKQMSGFKSAAELEAALPESTATTSVGEPPKRRSPKVTAPPDPFANDVRYQRGIANMAGFGIPRLVRTGFDVAAIAASDEDIRLSDSEVLSVEDHLYVMSKHMNIKMSLGMMWLLFVALLGELVIKRLITRTEVGKFFADLFKPRKPKGAESEPQTPQR